MKVAWEVEGEGKEKGESKVVLSGRTSSWPGSRRQRQSPRKNLCTVSRRPSHPQDTGGTSVGYDYLQEAGPACGQWQEALAEGEHCDKYLLAAKFRVQNLTSQPGIWVTRFLTLS